jgi:uncharacterized protein (TIGR02246 family)
MSADELAIREVVVMWMAATKAGNLAAVLNLMTDDVLFMTPGRQPFGKEEFRAASEAMAGAQMDGQAKIEEIQVADDWAWVRNHIDLTITPAVGPSMRRSGYTLTILRKAADGHWRLFRDANFVS